MSYLTLRNKKSYPPVVYDVVEIQDRRFEAEVYLSDHFGDASAMNGGRILSLLILEEGEIVGFYEHHEWVEPIADLDAAAYLASCYFIAHYNVMRNENIERSMMKHEHQSGKKGN